MKIAGSDDPEGALETERKIAREAMAELREERANISAVREYDDHDQVERVFRA
jgi:hypothetical protein